MWQTGVCACRERAFVVDIGVYWKESVVTFQWDKSALFVRGRVNFRKQGSVVGSDDVVTPFLILSGNVDSVRIMQPEVASADVVANQEIAGKQKLEAIAKGEEVPVPRSGETTRHPVLGLHEAMTTAMSTIQA